MALSALVSGARSGVGLQHPLAFAGTLWHRVLVNQETVKRVAADLGLDAGVCAGVVRLLKAAGRVPSRARLAVICQLDPGWDDSDVGEAFGESAEWSAAIRRDAVAIRAAEPIPAHLEWVDNGLKPFDPSPSEILQRALEIRKVTWCGRGDVRPGIRAFAWRPRGSSFFPIGAE